MDLLETSKLMREQNHRHTQYPLFIVQELQEVVKAEGCGDYVKYVSNDGENELTVEQYEAIEEAQNADPEEEVDPELLEELGIDNVDDIDLYDYRSIELSEEWVYRDDAGFFFTEKACHDHIKANHYYYNKPRSYVISAWRNYELQETMRMLLKLTGEEIPSQYQ